ncbi:MAG: hypothetical protein WBF33_38050, partial [Candidatus Nitrosopolaris sp.]
SNRTNYQQPVTLVPDIKSITGDYLASKVREYTRIYPGKIMSSCFGVLLIASNPHRLTIC